jgi:hypothetical protein
VKDGEMEIAGAKTFPWGAEPNGTARNAPLLCAEIAPPSRHFKQQLFGTKVPASQGKRRPRKCEVKALISPLFCAITDRN